MFDVDNDGFRGVWAWYAAYYEHHAEQEQIARAKGDEAEEKKHHDALLILVKALTKETAKA